MAHGDFREATRVIRAGLPEAEQGQPFLPGPTFAAPYHFRGDPHEADYVYGRYGNPTFTRYEAALGELEGGHVLVFSSGMAAAGALLLPRLRPGDRLVAPADCYMGVRSLARSHLAERGVDVELIPTADPRFADAVEGAALVWLETPSNPGLDVCDLRALIERGHAAGATVVVDNTFATPLGQRPLDFGADFSMASASKQLTGHADLILGYVAARDPDDAARLVDWRIHGGSVPGPFEVWLAHRSLATLGVRLDRACSTAQMLAERLAGRDDLLTVRYPGLLDDPSHELASRQMSRYGTILSFTLESAERADRFLGACRLVKTATSFGGIHSSAERRARWGGDEIAEGFIRFSVGCEDPEDIAADVEQALDASVSR
ncbi:MAG TPA: cystathionine gamma-lyase [Thermoleophilaceae bacterium]|nr:cystathionine gamma-lyase [Thermoleophilaceae bacterium]